MSDKNISAHIEMPVEKPVTIPEIRIPDHEQYRDPPVIIKPPILNTRSESAVTDAKLDELKGWMQKEFLSRMIREEQEQKAKTSAREELVAPLHHRQVQSASNFAEDQMMRKERACFL